jgi:Rap1a immunity proteins
MTRWIMIVAALVVGVPAYAASDGASGTAFYTSCMAAAEIVGGQRKPSEPESGMSQLEQATMCFGSVTAIANLEAFFQPQFAMCPPQGSTISYAQMILAIAAYLKNHPEQLHQNFHGLAVVALERRILRSTRGGFS